MAVLNAKQTKTRAVLDRIFPRHNVYTNGEDCSKVTLQSMSTAEINGMSAVSRDFMWDIRTHYKAIIITCTERRFS